MSDTATAISNAFVVRPRKARSCWSSFRATAIPALPYAPPRIQLGNLGAGEQAGQLRAQVAELFVGDDELAAALGWQVPPANLPSVSLQDADWTLEADELKF